MSNVTQGSESRLTDGTIFVPGVRRLTRLQKGEVWSLQSLEWTPDQLQRYQDRVQGISDRAAKLGIKWVADHRMPWWLHVLMRLFR